MAEVPMNLLQNLTPETLAARGLHWDHATQWVALPPRGLRVVVPPMTDCFRHPAGGNAKDNGLYLWQQVSGDFVVRLHVRPTFTGRYDAGGILIRHDEKRWAKLCFESTDLGTTAAVSVVTRGLSDDANGADLTGPDLWLQVCRAGDAFGMQYALDGISWRMVRQFNLPLPQTVHVGLLAQSPGDTGTTVDFMWFSVESRTVADTRTGA
jgi:regulation of enolase protein 1 (concanavalin A-like superfamily)